MDRDGATASSSSAVKPAFSSVVRSISSLSRDGRTPEEIAVLTELPLATITIILGSPLFKAIDE